jgi:hypothetical protein
MMAHSQLRVPPARGPRHSAPRQACARSPRADMRSASLSGAAQAGTEARPPLVVVGSVNADLVLAVERLPKPGETLGASSLAFYPGGKGANQAAAAARLGYRTYLVGGWRAGVPATGAAGAAALCCPTRIV